MKNFKYIGLLFMLILAMACKKEKITPNPETPTEQFKDKLTLVQTISNDTQKIDIYTTNGKLIQGYNKIYFQVKNNDGSLVKNATITWSPLMHMTSMNHAGPKSAISVATESADFYTGYLVFQMAGSTTEYWDLTFNYSINGTDYSMVGKLDVIAAAKKRVLSFTGTDNVKYVLAMVEPSAPIVGANTMKALLFKMENMMSFPMVDGYSVNIDPRMPSMGNHSSPNNVDLVQASAGNTYDGTVNFTMSGYWKINLMVKNGNGDTLKGEAITTQVEASSIYFEVEF